MEEKQQKEEHNNTGEAANQPANDPVNTSKKRKRAKSKWGLSFDMVLKDFLSQPESLKFCMDQYYSETGKILFDNALETIKQLNIKRVLFIGNTFNNFASYVPHYNLSLSEEPLDFTWQIYELTEFKNYFLPQDIVKNGEIDTLYIFVSNSGRSRQIEDSIEHLKIIKVPPEYIWLVSNNPTPTVADHIGFLFQTYVRKELVLGTKSYINSVFVLYLLSELLKKKNPINEEFHSAILNIFTNLSDYRNHWQETTDKIMKFIGEKYTYFYFISREPASYSTAAIGALSTMSFTNVLAESISLGLFFHGPFQIMRDDHICVMLIGDKLGEEAKKLVKRLITQISDKLGKGKVILISNDISCCMNNPQIFSVPFNCDINALSPIFEFTIMQYIALRIAQRKGILE